MSYDIYIGNAEVESENDEYGLRSEWVVKGTTHPDAPVFPNDEMTGNGNSRYPGYSQWAEFLRTAGLYALFMDKDSGLMRDHPGCQKLDAGHVATVKAALAKWRAAHPDAVPGFGKYEFDLKPGQKQPDTDAVLARLIWLDYWMSWAVATCPIPAIYNR